MEAAAGGEEPGRDVEDGVGWEVGGRAGVDVEVVIKPF